MSNSYFQFKQFRVNQEKSAMKVCTDSCIFGAFARYENPTRILDIGTGSGLLSLMLAQKYPCAIDAVEIDNNSARQALENFQNSPWKGQIALHHDSIQRFKEKNVYKYDLIVSNPPFFSNHLKSPDSKRNMALHNDELSFQELAEIASGLLSENGLLYILLPAYESELLNEEALKNSLYPTNKLWIYNTETKPVFRVITAYSATNAPCLEDTLIIKDSSGNYSEDFKELLNDYYLHL